MDNTITPLTPAQEVTAEEQTAKEGYVKRNLVAFDQEMNVVMGGTPDETISSRMARWDTEDTGIKHAVGHVISAGLDLLQKDHGAQAEAGDTERAAIVTNLEAETGDLPGGAK